MSEPRPEQRCYGPKDSQTHTNAKRNYIVKTVLLEKRA